MGRGSRVAAAAVQIRRTVTTPRGPQPRLALRLLGTGVPNVLVNGRVVPLTLRLAEVLAGLARNAALTRPRPGGGRAIPGPRR